ncbi:hypothetical protein [Rhodococcus sp. USK13]|uniref:hypothetical protein n=1 Tax=Rhodococcus sp. USK13 TaxID=2806442 RepID=UPI001BD0CAD6|nr:hypothetical protein [Rhodococcus sp. USK13]
MSNAKARFEAEVTEHQMTVLHDEGLYRHIKFARPGSNMWRFDLVTWPGHLAISGDLQSYTFSRLPDMFEFFDGRRINPSYWAEKVVAGRERTMEYSPERARQLVVEHFMESRHQRDEPNLPLWQAIRSEVLSRLDEGEHEAHRAISDFAYYLPETPRKKSEDFKPEPIVRRALSRRANFEFSDSWEWDLRDFDHHFLLICHAIQWGIAKYRAEVTARAA